MPTHLRALVVVLSLAVVVFVFSKALACAKAMTARDFESRRNLWFGLTLSAFLAHNFWIYIVAAAVLLMVAQSERSNRFGTFFFLLFAVPAIEDTITGLGVINYFFTINYPRLLALTILLPAYLTLRSQPGVEKFGRSIPDKLLAGYIILNFCLMLTAGTFTNSLRSGVFYAFVDIFLPYYVASRMLRRMEDFRDALMAFVVAALVLSAIGAFEHARHWLLYANLDDALGAPTWWGTYLGRGEGSLRAVATAGHAIALGYVIAVALGFLLFLKRSVPNPLVWRVALILLTVGLIVPFSRGPWLGAGAMLMIFIAIGPAPALNFAKLGLIAAIGIPILLATPIGEKIVDYLPFVGSIQAGNVEYRQRLVEIAVQAILEENPFFGGFDYMNAPAFQELKTGRGFLDIVNSYVGIALSSGLVGLSLFSGFFISVMVALFKALKKHDDRNDEYYLLGRVLLSVLFGILIMIATVSSITVVPIVYWCVAGLGVAYARMLVPAAAPPERADPDRPGSWRKPYLPPAPSHSSAASR